MNEKRGVNVVIVAMLIMFSLVSCWTDPEDDVISGGIGIEGSFSPNLTLPIAYGNISMLDIVDSQGDDCLSVEGDTLIFEYKEQSVISEMRVEDFFDVESLNVAIETSPIRLPNIGIVLPTAISVNGVWQSTRIEFTDGVDVHELDFWGTFGLNIATTDFDYNLKITVDELYVNDGKPFVYEVKGVAGVPYNESIRLEFDARFVNDPIFHIRYEVSVPAGQVIGGNLQLSMSLTDLDYKFAVGDFSKMKPVKIDDDVFNLGSMGFVEQLRGDFNFMEPVITLSVKNRGIGVPFYVDLSMTGHSSEGESAELAFVNGYKALIEANADPNVVKISDVTFNKQNSTIIDFVSLPPVGDVSYCGELSVADHGKWDTIWRTSSLGMDIDVKIPFVMQAERMIYSDTISDISFGNVDKVKSGSLKLLVKNGIPLNVNIAALTFIDTDGVEVLQVPVAGDGVIVAADGGELMQSTLIFNLDEGDFDKLSMADSLVLNIVITTDGTVVVKSTQELEFKLIVSAELDLSVN